MTRPDEEARGELISEILKEEEEEEEEEDEEEEEEKEGVTAIPPLSQRGETPLNFHRILVL